VEEITREQMESEFGKTGVQNPMVIDLITVDGVDGPARTVVLVMVERRAWGASAHQFKEIEEKVNRYMGYVIDGFLVQHYPQYVAQPVRIRLDCAEEPHGEAVTFVQAMGASIQRYGLEFALTVLPPA
jgi:hypothetical protein